MREEFGPIITGVEFIKLGILKITYTGWVLYGYEDENCTYKFMVSNVLHNEFGPAQELRGSDYYWLDGRYIPKKEHLIKVSKLGRALYG